MLMNKLTKREKVMLYILLCLVIVAGLVSLLILPAISRNASQKSGLDTLALEQQQLEIRRAALQNNLERIQQLESKADELYESLYDTRTMSEVLDLYITGVAVEAGVIPQNLSIGSTLQKNIQFYMGDLATEETASSSGDVLKLPVASVLISGSCSEAAFMRMTDAYARLSEILISNASFVKGSDEGQADTFPISLEIYLIAAR